MTFFATLLFGAGALFLISALENPPGGLGDTLRSIVTNGPIPTAVTSPSSSGGTDSSGNATPWFGKAPGVTS